MRVVIVDDEPLARWRLTQLCEGRTDLDIVAQAESGAAAIDAIRDHRPDLVLLDVELQDMTGFDVLRALSSDADPFAIMVTAHPGYAVKAFDEEAVDFLTKPVDAHRFDNAIDRARRRCAKSPAARQRIAEAPQQLIGEKAHRLYFLEAATVDYIESDGNYVTIHAGADRYISRNTIKRLAAALSPLGFVRIERSLLVNFRRVAFAERLGRGVFAFTLRSGGRIVSSANYRREILDEIRHGQLSNLREPAQAIAP